MLITMNKFFIHKEIVSAVMRAEFDSDKILYIIQSGCGNDAVPNVHSLAQDKSDGTQDDLSEEIERVFYQFPKYQLCEV